jgi:hypothetical protein
MAQTVTVWLRLNQDFDASVALNDEPQGAIPLVMRMRGDSAIDDEDFVFPYNPRELNIGQLSDETAQIARPATTPILAFKSHRLMTLDFTALIAHPGDGLISPIDKELQVLRKFASNSNKVFELLNYDIFTNTPYNYRNMSVERSNGLFFSITEMTINVTRRNRVNQITQANVSISLIENRNPKMNIAFITPLAPVKETENCKNPKFKKNNKDKCKGGSGTKPPVIPTLSGDFQKVTAESILQSTKGKILINGQWIFRQ